MVGDQAIQAAAVTGREKGLVQEEGDINPFTRRDSIPRSPPMIRRLNSGLVRQRSGSWSSVSAMTESNVSKRKREEDSMGTSNTTEIQELMDLIKKLQEDTNALNKEIGKTYKPKKEFKSLASSIALWTRELERRTQDVLGKELKGRSDMGTIEKNELDLQQRLHRENSYLREQIQAMEAKHKKELEDLIGSTAEVGLQAQCEECTKARKKEARRRMLSRAENFENFCEVTEEDWKDEVFPRMRTYKSYIWDSPMEYALILPCDKNIDTTCKIVGRTIEKYGGKEGLKRQNKQIGEVARMTSTLGFPDSDGNDTYLSRDIYCPIISDGRANEITNDEKVFQSLKTIKAHVLEHGKTKLATPEVEGISGLMIIRMMEFLFSGTNVDIARYKANDKPGMSITVKTRKNTVTGDANTVKRIRKPNQDALL